MSGNAIIWVLHVIVSCTSCPRLLCLSALNLHIDVPVEKVEVYSLAFVGEIIMLLSRARNDTDGILCSIGLWWTEQVL